MERGKKVVKRSPRVPAPPVRIPDDEVEYSTGGYNGCGGYRRSSHLEDPEDGFHDDYAFTGWQE